MRNAFLDDSRREEVTQRFSFFRALQETTRSSENYTPTCTLKENAMLLALIGLMTLMMTPSDLPTGSAPAPVSLPHFPDRLHAFVWRNWTLVPLERMAQTVGAAPEEIREMGAAMGLPPPPAIPAQQWKRSALTIIRRNWHLLPYEQLLTLLQWSSEQMEFSLREDDFLYIKLGSHKPKCEPIRYRPSDAKTRQREQEIARTVAASFPEGLPKATSPLFQFVQDLSKPSKNPQRAPLQKPDALRYCYSYFALYGDPLLDKEADPYPDAYLAKMAEAGATGVWLQAVLYKLAPYPWEPRLSERYKERLKSLKALVSRAKKHGIRIYLYLNEPRSMPLSFFKAHPELKGVTEGDYATLCTSSPVVRQYLRDSIASICRAVPDIGGFFTITASENLTSCWSHGKGKECLRCAKRSAGEVIAEVNATINEGIRQTKSSARLIAWDWGWDETMAKTAINLLPSDVAVMSVSEWDMPIKRGGIESLVGEYSVSAVGPGERAKSHWAQAKQRGLKAIAKIQAANSWELSAVPYIPALENVAQHALNLRAAKVDGLMMGWTLGGYPSPNLEVMAEIQNLPENEINADTLNKTLVKVATSRYGAENAAAVAESWRDYSAAFREFPFHIGLVYTAPMQFGVSNLLWAEPTGYRATMIGFPYDDLDGWRMVYPPEVFTGQMRKVVAGFRAGLAKLEANLPSPLPKTAQGEALRREMGLAEAIAIHFQSTANQARFVQLRREISAGGERKQLLARQIALILEEEIALAKRLYTLQSQDSRIGFEASNQYYYVPIDLLEKVLNCQYLLEHWVPARR